jgi:hypothetical protein
MVKYTVRFNMEEREQLLAYVNTGWPAAAKLLHARIRLCWVSRNVRTSGSAYDA